MKKYDTIIIGGGFYGLRIAQYLREELGQKKILVIEKESEVMQRASYNNQARIHGGYHYPRSVLTASRSFINLPIFSEEYPDVVKKDFVKYYAIANNFSKVSARQFLRFYERITAPIKQSHEGKTFFDDKLVEDVFEVKEYVFNSALLKKNVLEKLRKLNVDIHTAEIVQSVKKIKDSILVKTSHDVYEATYVINCTYSSINAVNKRSDLPILKLKHELTEMCLVEVPKTFDHVAFTMMCGPFFSLMPFPDKNLYTLSHVRYTPHSEWHDSDDSLRDGHAYLDAVEKISHFPQMYADIKRYMPEAKGIKYSGESLWEIKTVLPQSEGDDSRPILYKEHYGDLKNYICVMGGKIDNIYDVFKELNQTYGKK